MPEDRDVSISKMTATGTQRRRETVGTKAVVSALL